MSEKETEHIELFDDGVVLIAIEENGKLYTNQTGGCACRHPEVRGRIVEYEVFPGKTREEFDNDLLAYFCGPKHNGWCFQGIDAEDADYLDKLFESYLGKNSVIVDRERLKDSMEAWIYCKLGEGTRIVLTSNNSD